MFVCRVFLSPGGVGRAFEQSLRGKLEKLADAFPELTPTPDPSNHWVQFHGVDRRSVAQLNEFARTNGYAHDIVVEERPMDAELASAAYVPLLCLGECIDENRDGELLNSYQKIICRSCGMPDEDAIPSPYCVSVKLMNRRKQDIYYANNGIFIVSARLLRLLEKLTPELQIGPILCDERGDCSGSHYWVRPLRSLGSECRSSIISKCDACGNPIEVRTRESEDKFENARLAVTHFSEAHCAIALSGSWYGKRERGSVPSVHRSVFVSGELYMILARSKIKGLVRPSHVLGEGCHSAP